MKRWKVSEINNLRCLYVKSIPLKNIAQELNRTQTAINKALARFNIRKEKHPIAQLKKIVLHHSIFNNKSQKIVILDYLRKTMRKNVEELDTDEILVDGKKMTFPQIHYHVNKDRAIKGLDMIVMQ